MSVSEYTLEKDGFQILPLVQPCVFANEQSFWAYLQSLPELDLSELRGVSDLQPGHLGLDPRGILPYASTFHHVYNRDIRAIAYLHALPAIQEWLASTSDSSGSEYYIEQLYDGFSVRVPGQYIPSRKFRRAKKAIADSALSSRLKRKLVETALKDAEELAEEMQLEDFESSSIHLGEDTLDFETSAVEHEQRRHASEKDDQLVSGWVNLSYSPSSWAVDDLDYIQKRQSLNQFLTYLPNSHRAQEEEEREKDAQRVPVPPNHMVLIHPRLKTKLVKGTIKTSVLIRQYVSFRVSQGKESGELFSKETRERILERLEVPYLPSGHRPCSFQLQILDDDSRRGQSYYQQLRECAKLVRQEFRAVYRHVSNNYLYSLLEDTIVEDREEKSEDLFSGSEAPSDYPPKVFRHLERETSYSSSELEKHTSLFRNYSELDLKMVNKMRLLSKVVESIAEDRLTGRVEAMLKSRHGSGFLHFSAYSTYDQATTSPMEEEEERQRETPVKLQEGGARTRPIARVSAFEPKSTNFTWLNDASYLPLYRKKQFVSSLPADSLLRTDMTIQLRYMQNLSANSTT